MTKSTREPIFLPGGLVRLIIPAIFFTISAVIVYHKYYSHL